MNIHINIVYLHNFEIDLRAVRPVVTIIKTYLTYNRNSFSDGIVECILILVLQLRPYIISGLCSYGNRDACRVELFTHSCCYNDRYHVHSFSRIGPMVRLSHYLSYFYYSCHCPDHCLLLFPSPNAFFSVSNDCCALQNVKIFHNYRLTS